MIDVSAKAVLLDIEGTTSSIAFVYDVMFPFVRRNVRGFLDQHVQRLDVKAAIDRMACDAGFADPSAWSLAVDPSSSSSDRPGNDFLAGHVSLLMDSDSKSTGLKALQGLIWQAGFESGELQSHLFPDVVPAIEKWHLQGIAIGIYSSGSVVAQKLFFGHTPYGDLNRYFVRNYDTTMGPKRDSDSYQRIAIDFGFRPEEILFLSDISAELDAANAAGMQTIAVVRPGNAPLPQSDHRARIESFEALELAIHSA